MKTIPEGLFDEIVDRLVVEFDPLQVILFGSHAWGTPSEDSDIDLLVIVPASEERANRRATRAYRCLRGLGAAIDVIFRASEELTRFGSVPASFEAEILERGKVIYGQGRAGVGPGLAHQGVA